MTKKRVPLLPLLLVGAAFVLLVAMPAEAAAGARKGLSVCAGVIVPSLLPFLIISGLFSALGLPGLLARVLGRPLTRLGLSPYAATPLVLGLTGGYPVGAAAMAQLVREGVLSPEEAGRLLPCCNNTGPAFIVGVAGSAVFGSARVGLILYLCHIAAALALAPLCAVKHRSPALSPQTQTAPVSFAEAFPDCVRAGAAATVNICAYVVFFSVLTALLQSAGLFSALAAQLALRLDTGLHWALSLLTGLLEIGSGVGTMAGLPATPGNFALAAFLLGFGGLSVQCQTLSVLAGTNVKCTRQFIGRIAHGLISAALAYGVFTAFPLLT